jgi:hypothetical protein
MTELSKLAEYKDEVATVSEFGEWLDDNGYEIIRMDEPNHTNRIDDLIYQWLGIDKRKVEQERRELIKSLEAPATPNQ